LDDITQNKPITSVDIENSDFYVLEKSQNIKASSAKVFVIPSYCLLLLMVPYKNEYIRMFCCILHK
jgi:hypothetical protein